MSKSYLDVKATIEFDGRFCLYLDGDDGDAVSEALKSGHFNEIFKDEVIEALNDEFIVNKEDTLAIEVKSEFNLHKKGETGR